MRRGFANLRTFYLHEWHGCGARYVGPNGNVVADQKHYHDYWQLFPFGYQASMYSDLRRTCGIETKIRNFGIGGQTASQVCNRLLLGVPADYVTILAGINDVNLAVYNNNNATTMDKLSMSIVQTVNQGINTLRSVQSTVVIVIGTIPPFFALGAAWGHPESKRDAIEYINDHLRALVRRWNNTNIILADVYSEMVASGGWRVPGCCSSDQLHFTDEANVICGHTFARAIRLHWFGRT
jgi:lysophospholipase L1-like esterase